MPIIVKGNAFGFCEEFEILLNIKLKRIYHMANFISVSLHNMSEHMKVTL